MVSQLPCPCNISHSGSDLFFFFFFGVDKDRLFGMVYYVGEHGRSSYFFITRRGTSFFGDEGWVWFSSSQYCWLYLTSPRFYGASSGYPFYFYCHISTFLLRFFRMCLFIVVFSLSLWNEEHQCGFTLSTWREWCVAWNGSCGFVCDEFKGGCCRYACT